MVARGARIGCLTAADLRGLWVPPTTGLHCFAPWGVDVRHLRDATLHRLSQFWWPEPDVVATLRECLRQVIAFHDPLTALIVIESALEHRLIGLPDVPELSADAPRRTRQFLSRARCDAQSGTETKVRSFLESRNVTVQSQVVIDGVGRVDLLVGKCLVIELDSTAHHTGVTNYASDRRRDLVLQTNGYRVLRLTYEQVFFDWERTRDMLMSVIRRREHRSSPVPRSQD